MCFAAATATAQAGLPAAQTAGSPSGQQTGKNQPKKGDEDKKPPRLPAPRPTGQPTPGKEPAPKPEVKDPYVSATFNGLEWRGIGPAVTSGRVLDIAVDPQHKTTWIVATVGGVWRTTNAGTSW